MSNSAIPWTVACQAPLSTEFSRQVFWSGLPFPSPGDLPNPGIEPRSPTLKADSLPSEPSVQFSSVQFSCLVMSDSLQPHGLQHARVACPSPSPGVCSNSCWIGDAIQPSHPLSSPSPPAPSPSQHQSLFQWVNSLHEVAKVLERPVLWERYASWNKPGKERQIIHDSLIRHLNFHY